MILLPHLVDELDRAWPSGLTRKCRANGYVLTYEEWLDIGSEFTEYISQSSTAPLTEKQLKTLDTKCNIKAARHALRARSRLQDRELRFLNRVRDCEFPSRPFFEASASFLP